MNKTLGYIVCCLSPALFLLALVLLFSYLIHHRNHKVRAAVDLIFCILAVAGGVALYFLGMRWGHFTIDDFYKIRIPGWVGMGVVAVCSVAAALRNLLRRYEAHRTEKAAIRAEKQRQEEEKRAAAQAAAAQKAAEQENVHAQVEAAAAPQEETPPDVPAAPETSTEKI